MKTLAKKIQSGFSLIELVIVIVVLGILAAIAIPRYVDLKSDAVDAAAKGNDAAVRSAFAITIAQKKGYPTVTELLANLNPAPNFNPAGNLEYVIGGTTYSIPVYTDSACTTLATAVGNTVQCLGPMTP